MKKKRSNTFETNSSMDNIKLALPEKEWWEDGYEWDDDSNDINVPKKCLKNIRRKVKTND